ncbi:fungal-specific transcription factor domain-containing protein [Colletotrichum navitas]|uniref:Fungal-specific transcription factor domain-containing protein n=1 Tax=Colletotrichum navitas TaxID=681940 RepID=A0AAD8VAC6_9PEZI|nr:fungal-specific transcription factor domain-containing protein [Colletotrichum navitas]KAK1598068.1 fungal-specific transcription factor domain-containing protein [Colletotrichum navitas]
MSSSTPTPPDTNGASSHKRARSPGADSNGREAIDNNSVPKPKRLACMICRKRKLKCDGVRPSCSTCARLGHTCAYDEVRRKSGPKRGYVKALEERLKQVETLLKTQDPPTASVEPSRTMPQGLDTAAPNRNQNAVAPTTSYSMPNPSLGLGVDHAADRWHFEGESSPQIQNVAAPPMEDFNFNSNMTMGMNNAGSNFTWEMIGLGLEEPLPPQETIDELHQIYFEKIHPSLPMIHKYRYLAAMNLAPNQRPPIALRYAIWTLACSITEKYFDLKDLFYQRARKYVEGDYIKGYGEHMISVAHAQTHVLLASYEFKMMYFPRAWMNTGSAVRLCQMMGLHRLDGAGLDVKQCLPPPRDWTEREERRRTFWMAFCEDRYASIGTGWPMTVDEKDIMTNLPCSEEAFEMSRPEQTQSLQDCMSPSGAGKLSSFGGIVLMACLFGRNLIHLHRPDIDDRDHDLNGEFWKRHRNMDNILLNTSLCLPSYLKLPVGLSNPNIVFTNMSIHTSTICLHQAAIFKADKNRLPSSVSAESKVRCITAANEIASIMRMISHMDLSAMNPFISFCLYVAARVFVQYLKSRPEDSQTADSLRFLLSAMNALKRRNPLTESFLVQLDVDLEALAMRIPKLKTAFPRSGESPGSNAGGTKGPICDDPEGVQGIMSYRNECHFMKIVEDDGNPATAPNIVEPGQTGDAASSSVSTGFGGQNWLSAEHGVPYGANNAYSIPMHGNALTPSSGSMYDKSASSSGRLTGLGQSESSGDNNMSGSPDGDNSSNRPTPNSSSSDQRVNMTAGGIEGSGQNSFEVGPATAQQNINPRGDTDENANYFNSTSAFDIRTGLTPNPRFSIPDTPGADFGMSTGWGDVQGQAGMTPGAEGVLRSLMNMGPMDAMDLSSWDAAN